jgi:hypothetical protein
MGVMGGCTSCICLRQGSAERDGEPQAVIQHYLSSMQAQGLGLSYEAKTVPGADGLPRIEITAVEFVDRAGQTVQAVTPGTDVVARLTFLAHHPVESPIFGLTLHHDDLRIPLSLPRHVLFQALSGAAFRGRTLRGAGQVEVRIEALMLPVGAYRAQASVSERDAASPVYGRDGAARLEIVRSSESDGRGLVDHRHEWELHESKEAPQA